MIFFNSIIFFILGTIVGSYLNVVVLRHNTGRSSISGRSQCFSCGKKLSWYELVPIFSFVFLKGKCLGCESRISYQYPTIELITGLLFFGLYFKLGQSAFLPLYLLISAVLIAISVYDFKHKIIPNNMVYAFDILALIALIWRTGFYSCLTMPGLLDFLAGPILFAFFALLWALSLGRWMGLGDGKLALGVGWLLGFSGGIMAIMLAFWIGAIWGLLAIAFQKMSFLNSKLNLKSQIPFAPFIIFGLFLQLFTGWSLLTFISALS